MNVKLNSEKRAAAFETVKPSELRRIDGGWVGAVSMALASLTPKLIIMSR